MDIVAGTGTSEAGAKKVGIVKLLDAIINKLPGITEPKTYLSFKSRLMWTGIILLLFLVLSQISVYGIAPRAYERFALLELVLGAKLGSLLTLGIGPIVTASIILQLLVGSRVLGWDMKTKEGRMRFMGTQKILTILFSIFEAWAYVNYGVIAPADNSTGMVMVLIGQLAFGGFLILLMDEVVSKWGIGSGVSLFIAAGVSKEIFIRTLNPLVPAGTTVPAGAIPAFISYMRIGELNLAGLSLLPIIATALVFFVVVYIQAIRVDIPLAFTSIRGFARRWPLKFIYTSNMPVILAAALLANLSLVGSMLYNRGIGFLGEFDNTGTATGGIMYFLTPVRSISLQIFMIVWFAVAFAGSFLAFYRKRPDVGRITMISAGLGFVAGIGAMMTWTGPPLPIDIARIIVYLITYSILCTIFSVIWVTTAGMDADSVAEQIEDLGLGVPGFRRDPRIVRQVLNRYITPLAVLGGLTVGGLAAFADITGALGTGTGILLTVMIIYNFYEIIASRYAEEMHPALRRFFK